jgi:hypothetical protein
MDSDSLDTLLIKIRIIASKLMKIRACGDGDFSKMATNNLWTLHWALSQLLRHSNEQNLKVLEKYIDNIGNYADKVLKLSEEDEIEYLLTLLKMQEVKT